MIIIYESLEKFLSIFFAAIWYSNVSLPPRELYSNIPLIGIPILDKNLAYCEHVSQITMLNLGTTRRHKAFTVPPTIPISDDFWWKLRANDIIRL